MSDKVYSLAQAQEWFARHPAGSVICVSHNGEESCSSYGKAEIWFTVHVIGLHICPFCRHRHTASYCVIGSTRGPVAGDASICVECGRTSEYYNIDAKTLALRPLDRSKLTRKELAEIDRAEAAFRTLPRAKQGNPGET
jgi:hypothetical protein